MVVAPASIEFSTSSFRTDDGRSTTSPAAIWSATALGRMDITGIVLPKLPILTPRRCRDILLLALPLDVGFLILGRVEDCFRLLGRHAGYWLGSLRLIRTLRRRRAWIVALTSATTSSSATAAPSPAALLLAQRKLVIPSRV